MRNEFVSACIRERQLVMLYKNEKLRAAIFASIFSMPSRVCFNNLILHALLAVFSFHRPLESLKDVFSKQFDIEILSFI